MRRLPRWVQILTALGTCALVWAIWPVFACGCGQSGPRAACLSNLKQLSLDLLMYSNDNDDKVPNRDQWMDGISPYVKNPLTEHCVEVKGAGLYGYALNASVKDLKDGDKNAGSTLLVYDSVNLARNASDLGTSLPAIGRHGGRNNVAYADGHAKSLAVPLKASP